MNDVMKCKQNEDSFPRRKMWPPFP